MVSLTEAFLSLLCLTGTVVARYSNISSTTVSAVPKTTPTAFFSSVHLLDSYTGTTVSNDKEHWFVIEAELYISADFDGELHLTAPESFQGFPIDSFDLLDNTTTVGTVSWNSSNVLTIRPDRSSTDHSAVFNVLTKLSSEIKESITGPAVKSFEFQQSPGGSVIETIDFIAQDLSESNTNALVDGDNRITYSVNIPFSEYPGALNFAATFSGAESHSFDPSLTMVRVVVDVDEFNKPTKVVNVTAFQDFSDANSINLQLNSQISGGEYLQIIYATTSRIKSTSVDTVATLNYPSLSTYKRDISIMFEDHVALRSASNVEDFGEDVTVVTGSSSSAFPTITAVNTTTSSNEGTTIALTQTSSDVGTVANTTHNVAGSTSEHFTVVPASSAISSEQQSMATIPANSSMIPSQSVASSTSSSQSTIITGGPSSNLPTSNSPLNSSSTVRSTPSNNNGVVLTYTVVTRTDNGEYEVYTSFFPITTLSSSPSADPMSNGTKVHYTVNSTSTATNSIPTHTVLTKTVSGEVTVYTSLVPIATLSNSTMSKKSMVTKTSDEEASESTTSTTDVDGTTTTLASVKGHSTSSKSTGAHHSSENEMTGKTDATEVSSQSESSSQSSPTVSVSDLSKTETKESKVTGYQTKVYETNAVFTTTRDGRVIEYTKWYPVTTLAADNRGSVESSTGIESTRPTSPTESYPVSSKTGTESAKVTEYETRVFKTSTVVTTTSDGIVLQYTTWFPITTLAPISNTSVRNHFTYSNDSLYVTSQDTPFSAVSGSKSGKLTQATSPTSMASHGAEHVKYSGLGAKVHNSTLTRGAQITAALSKSHHSKSQNFESSTFTSLSPSSKYQNETDSTRTKYSSTVTIGTAGYYPSSSFVVMNTTTVSLSTKVRSSAMVLASVQGEVVSTSERFLGSSRVSEPSADARAVTSSVASSYSGIASQVSAELNSETSVDFATRTSVKYSQANAPSSKVLTYSEASVYSQASAPSSKVVAFSQVSASRVLLNPSGSVVTEVPIASASKTTLGHSALAVSSSQVMQAQSSAVVSSSSLALYVFDGGARQMQSGILGLLLGMLACLV
ncbi:LADA_0D00386g1_1 [Lachancea dasiensis]|uniref:LADA_0D00386g1_1 n=1 Tax=Lachancea dasiensis TaxID=1072105 RepID=A0A1G4J3D3_9SACH|nr:LADA_0D00386g1_1 [Lachancea dasiensis]